MSAEIKAAIGFLAIRGAGETVIVEPSHTFANVSRADFLAAVAAECGAIVIDRADLPEVRKHGPHGRECRVEFHDGNGGGIYAIANAEAARREVRAWAAVAEHLDAHPSVDEADVEALRTIVERTAPTEIFTGHEQQDSFLARDIARALLETGRVEVRRD